MPKFYKCIILHKDDSYYRIVFKCLEGQDPIKRVKSFGIVHKGDLIRDLYEVSEDTYSHVSSYEFI
jgi:hypothetical protein